MALGDSNIGRRSRPRGVAALCCAVVVFAAWIAYRSLNADTSTPSSTPLARESSVGHDKEERRDFMMTPQQATTLAGVVRSALGSPIAKARITLFQGTEAISSFLTDDAGQFATRSPSGRLTVKAEAEGFGAANVYAVTPTLDLVLTLFPGNVVSGRVLLEDSRQPVANVRVTAISSRERVVSPLKDSFALTDKEGNFLFPNLPAGSWLLSVAERNVWGEATDPILVASGDERRDVIVMVRAAASISGRFVILESGAPCPKGRLQLIPDPTMTRTEMPVLSAATSADGSVRFDAVPLGSYRVGPMCEDHMIVDGPSSLTVSAEAVADQRWKFSRGLGLTVNVIDESGAPIENAAVALDVLDSDGLSRGQISLANRRANTDARGQYRFGALRHSRYKVSAQHGSINGKTVATAAVDLKSGSEPPAVTLTLPGRGTIRISAHSEAGDPISRVLFFATDSQGSRYEGKYAGNGKFSIGPLPRDVYRVFGYDNKNPKIPLNGGAPVSVSGASIVDLDFQPEVFSSTIEGRVLDGNGNTIGGAFVRAVSTSLDATDELYSGLQTALHGAQEQMTDKSGRFRIDGLRSDAAFDLYIDHPSGLTLRRNDLRPGTFVEIALPVPATVTGTVVDESGRALDNFDVVVDTEGNAQSASRSMTHAHGQFLFSPVNPGKISVTIYGADGASSATRDLTATPGQVADAGRFVLRADEPDKS